jgi:hypothetical protein
MNENGHGGPNTYIGTFTFLNETLLETIFNSEMFNLHSKTKI